MFPDRIFEDVGEAEDPVCPLRGRAGGKSTQTSNYGKATDNIGEGQPWLYKCGRLLVRQACHF